ncbi:uncharacterized protein LOC134096048 isoform X1 [Sardina pilchardus]|uniref:uncharacterized protein LOC134096048 isoform X1 n=1 Tax=Sardina pilchardus TaxID=27697 RepID=UPI002E0FCE54
MTLRRLIVLWIVASSEAFLLQGPSGPLTAKLGGSVLLPCSVETPLPLEELEVEWRRTDSDVLVHLFQEGEERPESQDYAFRGRARFVTELAAGNYSLLLTNTTLGDAGVYICKVFTNLKSDEVTAEIRYIERLVVRGAGAVSAYVGDEVILDCSVDSHIPPERLQKVVWKRTDQEIIVLLYQDGESLQNSTHERYQGRAEFFTTEIPKGNFSLKLKDVSPKDRGEFICEAHSDHLSANTTVVLQGLDAVPVLIMACLLCVIALVLALGLGVPAFIQLMKNVAPGRYLAYVGREVVLPWDPKGLQGRSLVSVTWKRLDQDVLMYQNGVVSPDSPHHRFQFIDIQKFECSLKLMDVKTEDEGMYICEICTNVDSKTNTVPLQVYNGRTMLMHYSLVFCPNIIMFIAFMLYGVKRGFVDDIVTCATVNFVRFLLVLKTAPYLDLLPACPKRYIKSVSVLLQYFIVAGVLFSGVFADISFAGASTYFLWFIIGINLFYSAMGALFGSGIYVFEYWGFTYVDIINWILLWLIVVGYSTFNLSMYIVTLAVTLGVEVLFQMQQLEQYEKWYAISTILLVVLFPTYVITLFYYLFWILASKPGGPGLMCGNVLLYSLTAASGFNHPRTTADIPIPHVFVYIFGAAALPVLNSAALTTDLIMKLGTGSRMFSDLQVIILPCECVFVSGWLALQPYHYWIKKREKIKEQLKGMSEKIRCKDSKTQDP